jgi:predicted lactoylglutathione lyase
LSHRVRSLLLKRSSLRSIHIITKNIKNKKTSSEILISWPPCHSTPFAPLERKASFSNLAPLFLFSFSPPDSKSFSLPLCLHIHADIWISLLLSLSFSLSFREAKELYDQTKSSSCFIWLSVTDNELTDQQLFGAQCTMIMMSSYAVQCTR